MWLVYYQYYRQLAQKYGLDFLMTDYEWMSAFDGWVFNNNYLQEENVLTVL